MKKTILLLTLLGFTAASLGQGGTLDIISSKEQYLKKSRDQKTTGWVLLAGGTALSMIGLVTGSGEDDHSASEGFSPRFRTSMSLFGAGVVVDLLSIPFFVSSARNARTAATLSLNEQKIVLPQNRGMRVRTQPTVSVRIGL